MDESLSPDLGAIVPNTQPTKSPDKTQVIHGRFVTLQPMEEKHIPSLWSAIGQHAELWTHWPDGPYDQSSFGLMITGVFLNPEKDLVPYTIFQHSEVVGVIILQSTDLASRVMEIGMVYGPRVRRTRGATEALYLLASICFDQLDNRRLQWKTSSLNLLSRRAAGRYGFVYEGCLRQQAIVRGRNRDQVWYSMLDSEWALCKRAFEAWLDDGNFDKRGVQRRSLEDVRGNSAGGVSAT